MDINRKLIGSTKTNYLLIILLTTLPARMHCQQKEPERWVGIAESRAKKSVQRKNSFFARVKLGALALGTIITAALTSHLFFRQEVGPAQKRIDTLNKGELEFDQQKPFVASAKTAESLYKEIESKREDIGPVLEQHKIQALEQELIRATSLPAINEFIWKHRQEPVEKYLGPSIKAQRNNIVKNIDKELAYADIKGIKDRIITATTSQQEREDIIKNGIPNSLFASRVPKILDAILQQLKSSELPDEKLIQLLSKNGAAMVVRDQPSSIV